MDTALGRVHTGRAAKLHQVRGGVVGGLRGFPPVRGRQPGRVDDDGLTECEQLVSPAEQLPVGAVGPSGGVDARAVGRRHRLGGRPSGEFLADTVAAEQHEAEPVGQGAGQGGFSGPRQPADQQQPYRAGVEVPFGQFGQPAGLRGRAPGTLSVSQAGHLAAYEGAVGDVVVVQRRRRGVPGEVGVPGEEVLPRPGRAEALQVHREEGGVIKAVDVAQPGVELQAVQGPRPVVETEDVVGQQIAVALDRPTIFDPAVEQLHAAVEEPQRAPFDPGQLPGRDRIPGEPARLGEAVGPPAAQRRRAGLRVDLRPAPGLGVKGREATGEFPQRVPHGPAIGDQRAQPPVIRHPAHDDQVIAHRTGGIAHIRHTQIHIRRQPPVQPDLLVAGRPAGRERRVVEEPEVVSLLHLVGTVTDEEHHAGVGLPHVGVRHRRRLR